MLHIRTTGVILVAMSCLALFLTPALRPAAGAQPQTWKALAGGLSPDGAVESNAFHPGEFEVGVGDTVTWEIQGFHTVTFAGGGQVLPNLRINEGQGKTSFDVRAFSPFGPKTFDGSTTVNSGVPLPDEKGPRTFALTFTKEGRWSYFCLIHGTRAMQGTVVVKERPAATPDAVAQLARESQAASLNAGMKQWAGASPERQGKTVVVPLLGSTAANYSILRFSKEPLAIRPGTRVQWEIRDVFELHTVTFPGGQQVPKFLLTEAQPNAQPRFAINREIVRATPTRTYGGTGFAHSGLLGPPVSGLPQDYALTFTRPGRYEYVCAIHASQGMKGTVIVR